MSIGSGKVIMRFPLTLLCAAWLASGAEPTHQESLSAVRKLQTLADGSLQSGATVELLQGEMNAFLKFHAAGSVPEGVEDPELEFRDGGALVRARVDLDKASASSDSLSPLMRLLLRGSRNISLDIDYSASDGFAEARLLSMTVEDVELGGAVLEWFLESLAPPEWQPYLLGERIRLKGSVREIRLERGRALITVE